MEHVEPALERGAVRPSVELGRDEREEEVRELVVEFVGFACREAGAAKGILQRLAERMRVQARERPREERHPTRG